MLTAAQLRSARALLNLPQDQVAGHCAIKKNTLSDIENERTPGKAATLRALESFYESRGLQFIEGDGVKRSPSGIVVYSGVLGSGSSMTISMRPPAARAVTSASLTGSPNL